MRKAALAIVTSVMVGSAASAATPPDVDSQRCKPRSGEIILRQKQGGPVPDHVYYRNSEGRPVSGGKSLPLCNGVRYRIVPDTGANCVITVPSSAMSVAALEREIGRQAKLKRCAPPLVTRVVLENDASAERSQVLNVVPSGQVNIAYRRDVVAVVPLGPNPTKLSCEVAALPQSAKTVSDMLAAYGSRPPPTGCPPAAPSILLNGSLRDLSGVAKDTQITQTWPARDEQFDTRYVRPLWIAATSPQVKVPNLVDKTVADARAAARDLKLPPPAVSADGLLVESPEADERKIAAQSPPPDALIAPTERLVLTVRPIQAPPPPATAPVTLLATGALSGAAGAALLRSLMARRRPEDDVADGAEKPRKSGLPAKTSPMRVRPRPDLPALGQGRGGSTTLATLLPLKAVSPGLLLTQLEKTYPALFEWSRTEGAGEVPPQKLAEAIIAALPAAFSADLMETIVQWWKALGPTQTVSKIALSNKPHIEILSSSASNWTIELEAFLEISCPGATLEEVENKLLLSAQTAAWAVKSSIRIIDTMGNRTVLAEGQTSETLPSRLAI